MPFPRRVRILLTVREDAHERLPLPREDVRPTLDALDQPLGPRGLGIGRVDPEVHDLADVAELLGPVLGDVVLGDRRPPLVDPPGPLLEQRHSLRPGQIDDPPIAADFTSICWSYDVNASRSSRKYSSLPQSVISYSVRGGPPTVDGATSWACRKPCLASCLSAW